MISHNFKRTKFACYFSNLVMASVFVVPPMLFTTFHETYGISYTLLGTLVVINFCTQLLIDLAFTFFTKFFNVKLSVRLMPLLTCVGMLVYVLVPHYFPNQAYLGLVFGTIIFSVAAGLGEVLISPVVAAIPSKTPEKDMSLLHSLYGWGVVAMAIISSVFFTIFGTEKWKILILALAILPLISSAIYFLSPIPEMTNSENNGKSNGRGKILALCTLCIFLGSAAENTMTNWISTYMEKSLGLSKTIGDILGLAIFALLLASARMLYAKFTPDITKTLLISMGGAAICYIVTGLSSNVVLSFITCVLVGIFTAMLWPGTLILMEEKVPSPGVAAFALMAAGGDFGASVAPQAVGIIVDKASASSVIISLCESGSYTPEEIALKIGMLCASIFPIIGTILLIYIYRKFQKDKSTV